MALDPRLRLASLLLPAFLLPALLGLLSAATAAAQSPRISEIRIDQPSTDVDEYFELTGTDSASLDGLTYLVIGDGSAGSGVIEEALDLSGSSLSVSGFFVAAESSFTLGTADLTTDLNFENSDNVSHLLVRDFTGADGADLDIDDDGTLDATPWSELLDCVSLVETVGSGEQVYCATQIGPDGAFVPGHVLECPGGFEIGPFDPAGGVDTPGAANNCGAGPDPVVVINEVDYDQPGTDTAEFLELKNVGTVPADLSRFTVELINGANGLSYGSFTLNGTLAVGDYAVLCTNPLTVASCDFAVLSSIQNGSPDAVALLLDGALPGGTLVDAVSYEGDVPGFVEGTGGGLVDSGDGSLSRCPDGADSDQNDVDFTLVPPTPGAANDCLPPGGGGQLVINELDYDQPSSDLAEFIELKNTDTVTVDLAGFSLELINGAGGGATPYGSIALPAVQLDPGDYFVVCADSTTVFPCDLEALSSIQNGAPDAVALAFAGSVVDAVSYEGDVPGFVEGSGAGLEDVSSGGVGGPNDHKGLSRLPDGTDTDQNNLDFAFVCVTPGAANSAATADCADPAPPALVINEIDYDQPGADGAEFVEIKNAGAGDAELGGVELQLINGTGGGATIYQTVALPVGTLPAGGYFVVCADSLTVANCDLEALSSIQNGAPDAVALLSAGMLLDAVSYEGDTGAPFTEGSGTGLEDSGASGQDHRGIGRFPDGADTNQNNVDLRNACITPGRANSALLAGCTPRGPALEIFEIQGSGLTSPVDGQTVVTASNVVTAVGPDGFAMQTPSARSDGDPDTSDGIFVFVGGAPGVTVGDLVDVVGTAAEFFDFTEISGAPAVTVVGAGALPPAVAFDATVPSPDPTSPSCAIELECYEGMLVEVAKGVVTGPNQGFGSDPIAEVHVTAASERTFREPGIEFPGLPGLPVWDGNPEVFELDPDKLGLPNATIPAGSTFSATGILGFEFGGYELWPSELLFDPASLPVPVRPRGEDEVTIATLNLFRLFDDTDDGGEQVVSTAEYQRRLSKFSQLIREVLRSPDLLAVQEAEKLGVLEDLAALIAADDPAVSYTAYLVEGNDVGGIDVGFLVRDSIAVSAVTQLGAGEILTFDGSLLHDRPPLLLEGSFLDTGGSPRAFGALAVHNRSLGGIDDPADGPRVRQKRLEQAQSIAQMAQDFQSASLDSLLLVLGDFNAFEFSDGYVDVVGQVKGDVDPASNLLSGPDLVDPDLLDVVLGLAEAERYSFVFRGNAQTLDHVLISQSLLPQLAGAEFGRANADAAEELLNDPSTPLAASDHDALVIYLSRAFDEDGDGVPDEDDVCADTTIPESVPTRRLLFGRYALIDEDGIFDTPHPLRHVEFTIEDTKGCSCEQIIERLHLGSFSTKYGCGFFTMRFWIRFGG